MKRDILLAIDNGTQSLRALAFDPSGNLLAKKRVTFEPYFSDNPGWAEQDPEVFWDALCEACQAVLGQIDKGRIAGVSLTTQRGTVVNLDADGRPLRPAILWLDQRKTEGLKPMGWPWGPLLSVVGLADSIEFLRSEAESNWIAANQPGIWEKTSKFVLLSGFLTHRLIGEYRDSVGCQVGFIPFDYKKLAWVPAWDPRMKILNMTPDQLPEIVMPAKPLGKITREASKATGIPEGLPLIAAAADKACEVMGSGAVDPDTGCLSYGTTATINVNSKKFASALHMLPPYPSAVPGSYNMEVQIYRGYWMVSWFKEQFGYEERLAAADKGVEAEVLFEKLIAEVPPGSMGLMLQPYWTPGLKLPGPDGKGAIIGFGDVHTRAHLYRSILEGLAYALRDGRERIEKKTKIPLTRLVVSGGGSQSDAAMQLTADVFGLPAVRPHLYETSGLGAAIDCAVGLGLHKGFPEAVAAMTRPGDTFMPKPDARAIYDQLYNDVYRHMYDRLGPLYKRIREITGYPS